MAIAWVVSRNGQRVINTDFVIMFEIETHNEYVEGLPGKTAVGWEIRAYHPHIIPNLPGVTYQRDDRMYSLVGTFDRLEDAQRELKRLIEALGNVYQIPANPSPSGP
ncbi:MAG: hypothetical protein IMX00_04385 [Limnochordales bacterium]|nr:hypothetical protein [Limnochordales bacterium]